MSREKTRITTRPRLASSLIEAGVQIREVPNVWNTDMKAWEYPVNCLTIAIESRFEKTVRDVIIDRDQIDDPETLRRVEELEAERGVVCSHIIQRKDGGREICWTF